jgi:uncharacterized protein involved in response to NO
MAHSWTASSGSHRNRASLDALFYYGFRPFFLGASVYAALIMAIWIAWFGSQSVWDTPWALPVAGSPFVWHAHEMIFGFAVAAIAGFLLTAIPNWTGALPLSGLPLVALFLTWLAGRIVMAISGLLAPAIVAIVDLAFLPLIGGFATVQLFVRPAPRNLLFLVIIAAFTITNCIYHLASSGFIAQDGASTMRFALMLVVLMVAIIGGRIIPAFTHNWLHLNLGVVPMPKRIAWLDAASIASIVLLAASPIVPVPGAIEGLIALVAALLNGVRLLLWRGWRTWRAPIVWVLHLGYAWLVLGLFLMALADATAQVSSVAAFHALGAGAVGTMILAVMSRASLGHTGRPLVAAPLVVGAYWLVTLAAALRVAGSLAGAQLYAGFLVSAGLAWIAAFGIFALVYAPILTTPRVHTKVGARSLD